MNKDEWTYFGMATPPPAYGTRPRMILYTTATSPRSVQKRSDLAAIAWAVFLL